MSRHASQVKNKIYDKRKPARVVSITKAGNKKYKKSSVVLGHNGEIPLFNHERIFKAKKHDPL